MIPFIQRRGRLAPLDMAEAAWSRGELEAAAKGYEAHIRRAPHGTDLTYARRQALRCLTTLGDRELEVGGFESAAKAYLRAAALAPDYPDIKRKLASALAASGHLREARKLLDGALASNPGFHFARVERALIDFASGYHEEAFADIEDACFHDPRLRRERLEAALRAYRRGENQAALDNLRAVIPAGRNQADFYTDVGDELMARGRPELAVAEYHRALAAEPLFADTRLRLARALLATAQPAAAAEEVRRCLEINPRFDEARAFLRAVAKDAPPTELQPAYAEAVPRAS